MPACFLNQITIGPGNDSFTLDETPAGGAVSCTVANGTYGSFIEFRNAFMAAAQAVIATLRSSLSSTGFFTLDNNGGNAYAIAWTDTPLRDLLGYTADLAMVNSHPAPRRIGASLYLEHGGGPTAATIGEHDPLPGLMHVTQTDSLSGVRRTTRSGVQRKRATFGIQYLDNTARLVSQASAVATTYANAASTEAGLTVYEHAKTRWYDSTNISYQGWSDGRPVRYYASSLDAYYVITGAQWVISGTPYTSWVFDEQVCKEFPGVKARPPLATKYHLNLPCVEYLAP